MNTNRTILLKKKYGQHFLRDERVTDRIINTVAIDTQSSIFEIGAGDGFLTRAILTTPAARLWTFEIDPEWSTYIKKNIVDPRLTLFEMDFLQVDFSLFEHHKPWILLANVPYQITFPILYLLQKNRSLLKEGVIMIQEEVAQKIVSTRGKTFGFASLFFQHFFSWKLLDKIPPSAFHPPPKIYSRLLHFIPKKNPTAIKEENAFWNFIKLCFSQPRRTLKNNLIQSHYDILSIPEAILKLRAQQMDMEQLLALWEALL